MQTKVRRRSKGDIRRPQPHVPLVLKIGHRATGPGCRFRASRDMRDPNSAFGAKPRPAYVRDALRSQTDDQSGKVIFPRARNSEGSRQSYTDRLVGVGTPTSYPRRTTAPFQYSNSVLFPSTMSRCKEVVPFGGRES